MDEFIDILDPNGNPTGETELKSTAHGEGLFHATVHIWFYTMEGNLLLQQRGKDKDTYPLFWDVSVAGHVGAGETIEKAAQREIGEEIGLEINMEKLEKIGIFKSEQKHHDHLVDREFHHTFLCELKLPLTKLRKQDSEVEDLALIELLDFENEINNDKSVRKYVPHNTFYFHEVIKAIKKRL